MSHKKFDKSDEYSVLDTVFFVFILTYCSWGKYYNICYNIILKFVSKYLFIYDYNYDNNH